MVGYDRLQSVSSKIGTGSTVINSHTYLYDNAGRRTAATVETGDVWNWGYTSKGEATDARKLHADGTNEIQCPAGCHESGSVLVKGHGVNKVRLRKVALAGAHTGGTGSDTDA